MIVLVLHFITLGVCGEETPRSETCWKVDLSLKDAGVGFVGFFFKVVMVVMLSNGTVA